MIARQAMDTFSAVEAELLALVPEQDREAAQASLLLLLELQSERSGGRRAITAAPRPSCGPGPCQADSDEHLIRLWLHGRPRTTAATYSLGIGRFLDFLRGKGLREVVLADLQAYVDTLADLAVNSRVTYIQVVKSLFSFAHKLGYVPFNVGAAVRAPKQEDALHERYLTEEEVSRMLALEPDPRNHAMLRLLYIGGLRVSELVSLTWKEVQPKGDRGLVTVLGKGSKRRSVVLPVPVWEELLSLRNGAGPDAPVFASTRPYRSGQHGNHLTSRHAWHIVKQAAARAGITKPASPHWFRHAHISHALDAGAPLHLVAATVGHSNLQTTGRYSHARPDDSSCRFLPNT